MNVRFAHATAYTAHRRDRSVAFGDKKERFDRACAEIATVAITAGNLSLTHHHVVGAVAVFHHQAVVAEWTSFPECARIEAFALPVQSLLFTGADPGANCETEGQRQRQPDKKRYGAMRILFHHAQCTAKVTDR